MILLTFAVVMGTFAGLDMDARASEPCIFTADQNGTISCNYDYTNLIISAARNTEFKLQFNKPEWLGNGNVIVSSFNFKDIAGVGEPTITQAISGGILQSCTHSLSRYSLQGTQYLKIENNTQTPYGGTTTITEPKWKISVTCTYDAGSKELKWDIVAELYDGPEPLSKPIGEKADNTGGTGNGATEGQNDSPHTHSYAWITVQDVTADQDGIEEYRCSCGDVQERCVLPRYMAIVKGLCGAVKDAPQNGTVTFDTGSAFTMTDYVIRKLSERVDVTTVVTFKYQNQAYRMTIPAGADYTALLSDGDYFYGYFYFANAVGATIEAM